VKLGRAVAHAETVGRVWEAEAWCRVRGWMFLRVGNMAVDSVEAGGETYVRSAGFEEAWEGFGERVGSVRL